jgi:hypothetical protein
LDEALDHGLSVDKWGGMGELKSLFCTPTWWYQFFGLLS